VSVNKFRCQKTLRFRKLLRIQISVLSIGVGAGKFLSVRRIFSRISPNFSEKRLGRSLCEHFLKQNFFWDDLQKRGFHMILQKLVGIFSNQTTLGAIFSQIFRDFARIFTDFAQISKYFARIFTKSKHLGVRFHPLNLRLLHHWSCPLVQCAYSRPLHVTQLVWALEYYFQSPKLPLWPYLI